MSGVYRELTRRNAGFVSTDEQETLRRASVFVCGVGGMGGAAANALVRSGVGRLTIADYDAFELSNLNRQTFAFIDTIGLEKTAVTRDALMRVNPELEMRTLGAEWVDRLDDILPRHGVVVNAMDDLAAGIRLYRKARDHGATVVDAYVSPCPSVAVVGPEDPRPEERLGFPTVGVAVEALTEEHLRAALMAEIDYVATHSSGIGRLDPEVVQGILTGRLPRSSFAPVVAIAGNLMAFEAVQHLLGRPTGAGCEGYFVDLWSGRIERAVGA